MKDKEKAFKLNAAQQKIVDKATQKSYEAIKNPKYAPKHFVDKMTSQQNEVKSIKN